MDSFESARNEALDLMATSLLRELSVSEEARLLELTNQYEDIRSSLAAFQAMAASKALVRHEQTADTARAKFLDRAKSLRGQNLKNSSLLTRLWQSPRAWGGGFLIAQMAFLLVFVQVIQPSNQNDFGSAEPLYRSAQNIQCGDYRVIFNPEANFSELFVLMANSSISIVKGPDQSGSFELVAPGQSESEVRENLSKYITSFSQNECKGAGQ